MRDRSIRWFLAVCMVAAASTGAHAQVTPAAGYTPPDDTPKVNVGATIFADYTYQDSPKVKDADGNNINPNAFNVSRAYINITGNLNHLLAFRITPDIARETGSGSSLSGSLDFRVKYAYGQLNLDDWTTHGSWVRFGIHHTPFVDYDEGIYRYRFQGTIFEERVGLISSSDAGVSGHWNFPGNYGDVHAGFYNGENYNKAEANNQKGFMIRGTVRPLPLGGTLLKGLRVTGFIVDDHYVESAKRQRTIGQVTYEHPWVNAGLDILRAKDQTSVTKAEVKSKGWSAWVTPKFGTTGFEALLRHDNFVPNDTVSSQKQKRDIDGVAYWFPNTGGKQLALLLDRDQLKRTNLTPAVPNTTNYELKMLINF
jgi:hypothetical protein